MKNAAQAVIVTVVTALAPAVWAVPITQTTTQTAAFEISLEEGVTSASIGQGGILSLDASESETFSFSPFDPSTGTLLGVSFSAAGTVDASLSAIGASEDDTFSMFLAPLLVVTVTDPGGTFGINDVFYQGFATCDSQNPLGTGNLCDIGPVVSEDEPLSTSLEGSTPDPTLYTGAPIDLELSVDTRHSLVPTADDGSFSGTIGLSQSFSFTGTLTLEYLWEAAADPEPDPETPPSNPVPAPASLLLLIAGLLPMGWLARRRR